MNNIAFIFDLDGVIVDTAKYHYLAWKNVAKNLGIDFSEEQNELLKGVSRVESLEIILRLGNVSISEEQKQKILDKKNVEYLAYINKMSSNEILPGVLSLIKYLTEHNIKFALGSASKNALYILKKVELFDMFSAIVDGNDVTKAKPDPEVFLLGAKHLNMKPEDCVVIEDSIAGIQAANKAAMISIGVGDERVLHEADYVFKDLSHISNDFLNNLIKRN